MSKLNFVVHCGGKQVSRDEIEAVMAPPATRTHFPISHNHFAQTIHQQFAEHGLQFGEQAHALSKNQQQYFGMAEVLGRGNSDFALIAGWRSSYDKTLASGLVIGSQVFVCDNLAFSGEIQFARKHTRHIMRDLPYMIADAVSQTGQMAEAQVVRYDRYKSAAVSDPLANHAIIQMLRKGILPTSRVDRAVQEYYEPSHDEHLDDGKRTNWTLFNAATEALKGSSLTALPKRTIELHNLIDTVSDYALAA